MPFLRKAMPATRLIVLGLFCLVTASTMTILGTSRVVRSIVNQMEMTRLDYSLKVAWHLIDERGGVSTGPDGELLFGTHPVQGDTAYVDDLTRLVGGVATVFQGDVRIATTIRDPSGARATGTRQDYAAPNPASLWNHSRFLGVVPIFGESYYAAYDPIRDRTGRIVGTIFIGLPQTGVSDVVVQAFSLVVAVAGGGLLLSGIVFYGMGRRLGARIALREDDLERINRRLDTAMDNMANGLAVWDSSSRMVLANRRVASILGVAQDIVVPGLHLRDLISQAMAVGDFGKQTVDEVFDHRMALVAQGREQEFLVEMGDGRTLMIQYRPMGGGGWLTTYDDVTERCRAERELAFMAHHDALTGLGNRTLFHERLSDALARDVGLEVLCLDLDHFKAVNDTMGHAAGDLLLCEVSRRLSACAGATDTVVRLGGDEFAVMREMSAANSLPADFADRIISELSRPYRILGQDVLIGTSVGIAAAPADGASGALLLGRADMALYKAKEGGRGRHRSYEQGLEEALVERQALEADLRHAVDAGEMQMHYQPLVDVKSGKVRGFEALMRWKHAGRGNVSPADFIPVAEESGLIVSLGAWALGTACRDACAWPREVGVAVNLSAVQFKSPSLVAVIRDALLESGLEPERLELEITESVLLRDMEATRAVFDGLRSLGVRIAMDDFGTGYASLSYLRNFPFDKIKIDRSFVNGIGLRRDSEAIVRAVTDLAASLGIASLAEGVETVEQLEHLRRQGCDQVQGYYLGKPLPASEALAAIERLGNGWKTGIA